MAPRRKTTEQQDGIIALYLTGATSREVAKHFQVGRSTIREAFKARGVEMPKRKPGAQKQGFKRPDLIPTGEPVRVREPFNHFQKFPEVPCACGQCGKTFRRTRGQTTRLYAPGCPTREAIQTQKNTASAARRRAAKAAAGDTGGRRGRPAHLDTMPHKVTHWCERCGGMPWRRPKNAPCGCGGVFAEETMQRPDGRVVVIGELEPDRMATIARVDRYEPVECYTDTNRKARKDQKGHDPLEARARAR